MTVMMPPLPTATFPEGSLLTRQGEPGDAAWLILEGEVEVFVTHGDETRKVGRLSRKQVVGEMALIDPGLRTATVVARTQVSATEIPRLAFDRLLAESEPLARHILSHLINAVRMARGVGISEPQADGPAIRSSDDGERILERRVFGGGHLIFRENDPAESAYLIQSGKVLLTRGDTVLSVLGPGRMFGEVALLRGTKRTANALVDGAGATVEIIRRREFDLVMQGMPKILQALARTYLSYPIDMGG